MSQPLWLKKKKERKTEKGSSLTVMRNIGVSVAKNMKLETTEN